MGRSHTDESSQASYLERGSMSYDLIFSPEFFGSGEYEPQSERPTTLAQAINSIPDDEFAAILADLDLPENTDRDTLFDIAVNNNTCTNLTSPVEVWIDKKGYNTVLVY